MDKSDHVPVLLDEVIKALDPKPGQTIVDATYGRGGHAREIYSRIVPEGRMLLIDRDQAALAHAQQNWQDNPSVQIHHGSFTHLESILKQHDLYGRVDAILFDFGVSSPQLDSAERGFSFSSDGPLDMRMDQQSGVDAATWIREVDEQELVRVLRVYGEEKFARRIARAIKSALLVGEIRTTGELVRLVTEAIPHVDKHKHPATRTFQAIRIAVNDELGEIERVLPVALDCLRPGGRLVMISFHSLEDRIVKRFIRDQSRGDPYPVDLPVTADMLRPRLEPLGKAVRAGEAEVQLNPRARSAIMRAARKLGGQEAAV